MRTIRWVGGALAALALLAVIAAWLAYETGRIGSLPHRVEELVEWEGGCTPTQRRRAPVGLEAVQRLIAASDDHVYVTCGEAGPGVRYLRFGSPETAERAIRAWRASNDGDVCLVGDEALVDGLDRGFPKLCRDVDGKLLRQV